jgi:8-oxo-dGTP diphosphatase
MYREETCRLSPWKQRPSGPVPIASTVAVTVRGSEVLLVRRANRPDAGRWGFPGGRIGHGESLLDAAGRALFEKTGVRARPERVLTAVDAFDRNRNGSIHRHYVLIAVLCAWTSGEPQARDGALEARWYTLSELEAEGLALSPGVAETARQALEEMARR